MLVIMVTLIPLFVKNVLQIVKIVLVQFAQHAREVPSENKMVMVIGFVNHVSLDVLSVLVCKPARHVQIVLKSGILD